MSELPDTWAQVPISEVAEVNPRKSVDLSGDDPVSFVPMAAVDEVSGTIAAPIERPYSEVSKGFTHFRDGDVIFAKITPSMENGKSAVARDLTNGTGMGSTEFHVFRSYGAIEPEYLWRYVRQQSFRDDAQTVMSGAVGQQRVPADWLKEHTIPLAPTTEQGRIVKKLDGLTARTSRARKELDRIPTLIARYKQRLLALAFSGELIGENFDARQVPLSSVVVRLDQGWSPKCENFPSEDPSIWGVIKTTAIQPVDFLEHENKQLPAHLEPRPRIEISAGEVLVTRAGPRNRVGIACYVRKTRPRLMLADKVYRLAIDPAKADPLYVTYMLNSPNALSVIEAMKSGGSESGLNLTQDKFLGLVIPVPSIPEQNQTVRRIESAFGWLDRVATDHAAAARLLPKLDAAILAKAFRGELVPQDANDEPAAKLLERIRADREAEGAKPKKRRGTPRVHQLEAADITAVASVGTATLQVTRKRKKAATMSKSRQDDDVKDKPYLAGLLKSGRFSDAQSLFRAADLPVADFYKQLAWEIDAGHIVDSADELKAA